MNKNLVCLMLAAALFSSVSRAELPASDNPPTKEDLLGRIDLAVPEAPAFTVLGVTPENITRPTSGRALAVGLLNGVDANGNLQRGIALDTRPYLLAAGKRLTLEDYRNSTSKRMLSRLNVSFATASGESSEDKADRLALGIKWTPWDEGDIRLDEGLDNCFQKLDILDPKPGDTVEDVNNAGSDDEQLGKVADICIDEAELRLWNASSWDLGVAAMNVNADETENDDAGNDETGAAFWTSLALRVTDYGQVIGYTRYFDNMTVLSPEDNGEYTTQEGYLLGTRFRFGGPKLAMKVEATYSDVDYESDPDDSYYQILLGGEFRIWENLWVNLAIGDTYGDNGKNKDDAFVSGELRWALSEESLLK